MTASFAQLPCPHRHSVLQNLFKKMAVEKPQNSRMSVDSGHFVFHYMIEADVCYLTLTEKSYPKKLAYQLCQTRCKSRQCDSLSRPNAPASGGETPGQAPPLRATQACSQPFLHADTVMTGGTQPWHPHLHDRQLRQPR